MNRRDFVKLLGVTAAATSASKVIAGIPEAEPKIALLEGKEVIAAAHKGSGRGNESLRIAKEQVVSYSVDHEAGSLIYHGPNNRISHPGIFKTMIQADVLFDSSVWNVPLISSNIVNTSKPNFVIFELPLMKRGSKNFSCGQFTHVLQLLYLC